MVPGPALLMIMSLAVIHSGMLSTKPLIVTCSSTHTFTNRTVESSVTQQHTDEKGLNSPAQDRKYDGRVIACCA